MLVKIMDNARFNRGALLNGYDAREDVPERPGLDYVKAAELVWFAMYQQAMRSDNPSDIELENEGKTGRVVTGLGPYQAIRLLWPELTPAEFTRAGNATR